MDSKYDEWTNIELAEAMVDSVDGFEDCDAADMAETWSRSDMIKELVWAHGDGLDEMEEGEDD